jgi:hypothetical protein
MRRKIIGREDKSFVATAVVMPTNKINKDSTNFMRNINNKLRKTIISSLNTEEIKTTRAKLLSKGFDFEFLPIFYKQNR